MSGLDHFLYDMPNILFFLAQNSYFNVFSANFTYLFAKHAHCSDTVEGQRALEMCVHTLRCMAKGGIHDHVAQVRVNCVNLIGDLYMYIF